VISFDVKLMYAIRRVNKLENKFYQVRAGERNRNREEVKKERRDIY
jgi:hypothetical protein